MGKNAVFRDGAQILRDPQGQLVRVDPSKAEALLNTGVSGNPFQPVSEAEVLAAERLRENQTLSGKAETALLGAAENISDTAQTAIRAADSKLVRTLNPLGTVGVDLAKAGAKKLGIDLTDPTRSLMAQGLGSALGPEAEQQYADREKELAEANPGWRTGGELVGGITTGLLTGGLTSAGGELVTQGAAKLGAKQVLAKAAGAGLSMAAEGGFYGAAGAETQARLSGQDTGATAEQLLQGIGFGALLGGGIGASGSLGMSAFRRLVAGGEHAEAAVIGEQAGSLGKAHEDPAGLFTEHPTPEAPNAVAKLQSTLTGAKLETLERFGPQNQTAEAVEGRALWRNRGKLIEEAVPKMTGALNQMDEALEAVTSNVKQFELKESGVARMLEGVDEVAAKRIGISRAQAVSSALSDVLGEIPSNKLTDSVRKRIENAVNYTETHLDTLDHRSSAAHVFVVSDFVKRELQSVEKSLQFTAMRTTDGTTREAAMMALRRIEDEVQEPFRLGLENERIWGRAGKAQREINARWKPFLETSGRYSKELTTSDGVAVWADGRQKYYADTAKVQNWIEGIGTTRAQTAQEVVRGRIKAAQELLDTISEYHPLDPEQSAKLQSAREAYRTVQEHLERLDTTVGVANEIEDVAKAERDHAAITSPLGGRVVGALTGTIAAGPMGGVIGGLGMLNKPASAMLAADQIRAMAERVGVKTNKTATNWVKSSLMGSVVDRAKGAVTGAARATAATVERTAPVVRKVAAPTAVELFQGRHRDLETAYADKFDRLQRAQQDPTVLLEGIAKTTGGLHTIDPDLAGSIAQKMQTAVGFLVSKLPSGTLDPTPLAPNRKAIIPRLELTRFARLWSAVERPMSVLEDLRRGLATPDQIEALRVCHPETLKAIQQNVESTLLDAARRGENVPLAMRQQLDLLLDLGGAGEPAFSPALSDRIVSLQLAKSKQAPGPSMSRKAPKLSASLQLPQSKWPSA